MRHGKGTHACANGDIYKGHWRLDKRHGRGRATFVTGVQYEGDWADDKAHGCASCTGMLSDCCNAVLLNAVCRTASHRMMRRPGMQARAHFRSAHEACMRLSMHELFCIRVYRQGKARYDNGGTYVGEFKQEQRCGWGRHTFPNGDVYEGEWAADKIHGLPLAPQCHAGLEQCLQRPSFRSRSACLIMCSPAAGCHLWPCSRA